MARSISMKMKKLKASTSKPNVKPPPGDESLGLEPVIGFYEIEEGGNTEEGEES